MVDGKSAISLRGSMNGFNFPNTRPITDLPRSNPIRRLLPRLCLLWSCDCEANNFCFGSKADVENHYMLGLSPSGIDEFFKALAVPAPDDAVAPTEPPAVLLRNVHELAAGYGILPG